MNNLAVAFVGVGLTVACGGTETGSGGGDAGQAGATANGGHTASGGTSVHAGTGGADSGTTTGGSASRGGSAGRGGGAGRGSAGGEGPGMAGGTGGIPADVGSGACHDFEPCGGDPVGSWSADTCLDPGFTTPNKLCPTATQTLNITGEVDIRADGTMSSTLHAISRAVLPASCVAQLGPCGQAPAQGAINPLEKCVPGADGSCVCTEDSAANQTETMATYMTNDAGLFTNVYDGQPHYSYYCREADGLWVRGVDAESGRISVVHLVPK